MLNISEYFSLSDHQAQQFAALDALYREWNSKINVISRKDIDNLYEHHILHSLAIARFLHFTPDTTVLDVGTGGGFPGIPLAILFPECHFLLVDSVGKKIKVASAVAEAIGLDNVECVQERVEDEKRQFDFVVSRAVMPLTELVKLTRKNIAHQGQHNALPNGLIVLKGGKINSELAPFKKIVEITPVMQYFNQPWFDEKYVIYLPL